ncbi:MAG TPA: hypothetical protein VFW40_11430 [Capsulimonadaceae bacterium]|nr:hypothetical protein [Capsulimonadaceae bacterium]
MPINPKPSRRKAAIIGTDLDQGTVRDMKGGLKDAGWSEILLVDHFPLIVPAKTGRAAQVGKWQLPHALKGCDCLVLDEWIGGRSSFELIALLNASAERDAATLFCLFGDKNSNPTAETTVLAAYALGVDVLLTKPFAMDEFHSLVQRVHEQTP